MTTYILRPVTRVPTLTELARAFSYIEGEFVIREGIVRADMWIEGLAWGGSHEIDESDMLVAQETFPQLTPEVWTNFTAAADDLRAKRGIGPIFR